VVALIAANLLLLALVLRGSGSPARAAVVPEAGPPPAARAPAAGAAPQSDEPASGLARLARELAEERRLRDELERRVDALERELLALRDPEGSATAAADEPAPDAASPPGTFAGESLLDLGVAPYEVERLQAAWEQWELDKLYVHDEARRGGYAMRPRHRRELRDLREELRRELGDEDFDRLLYGSGERNRIVVTDVLGDSAALDAGIEPGDSILAYDGRRVFRGFELKRSTGQGEGGELVAVDLLRDGRRVRTYLPRGPMGVLLEEARRPPR